MKKFNLLLGLLLGSGMLLKAQIPFVPAGTGNTMMLTYADPGARYVINEGKKPASGLKGLAGMKQSDPSSNESKKVGDEALLVWDRQTGKSTGWHYDEKQSQWTEDIPQLPAQPLSDISGNVMMLQFKRPFNDVYKKYDNTMGRGQHILVWDTKTGKSKIYSYFGAYQLWVEDKYQLPDVPLDGATGEIAMAQAMRGNSPFEMVILVWDTKSGKSKIYTREKDANGGYVGQNKVNDEYHAWTVDRFLNLPENPIPNATGDIFIYPFVDSKTFIAYDNKSGKSASWMYDAQLKQMAPGKITLPTKLVNGNTGPIVFTHDIYVTSTVTGTSTNYKTGTTSENFYNTNHTSYFCWDAKTGKSVLLNSGSPAKIQMPESPMDNPSGFVMFTRFSSIINNYYTIVWDTKSGNTALYQFSKASQQWVKLNAQLPSPLLK